ncbi:MAG TPA: primase-helicase family protein [Bradyrhizobium sp.]|nr:primase-helicase family protein [Bradyrhizobium sp.]
MSEQYASKTSPDDFDGEAISRADREFLAKLSDHPLMRNPLYSVPPPPLPDYAALALTASAAAVEAAQRACFVAALEWMLVNYAFCKSAFMGKGGVISLVDGELGSIASLRGFMLPYALTVEGPRGGRSRTISVVDDWMKHPLRVHIDKIQTRSDRPRPTFEEEGLHIYNRYWPPAHPTSGGEIATFKAFFARLIPDDTEREWMWNYLAHKARKPWVPMIAVIMVAEEFGTGRGTLFEILERLFGEDYVVPCTFGEITGTAAGARFNDRLANALIATVNEAADEDGHHQARRRLNYEALKNAIEPSPTARHRFEAKGQHAYAQRSARTIMIATNHRDVVKLPPTDRRFCVIACGSKMTLIERADIRAWMGVPENIGALHRALLMRPAVPLDVFDPYGDPPPFAGRLKMIGMGETRLEDAYGTAIDALDGCPLFTMTQMQRLIAYFGDFKTGDWSDKARHTVAKNAYRLRERSEPNNRIKYRKRQEIIYARTNADQLRWRGVDTELIIRRLDMAEERVTQVVNAERDVLADLIRTQSLNSSSE